MKKLIGLIIIFLFIMGGSIKADAGDGYIDSLSYDGSCVKVTFASTEDDSSDKFFVRVSVRTRRGVQWQSTKNFRNVSTNTKYVEFCGRNLRAEHCQVNAQLYHNRVRESSKVWRGSSY